MPSRSRWRWPHSSRLAWSSRDDLVAVAASGTSGAGRAVKANLLASEVMGDLSPYKVGAHQHVPEILQMHRCGHAVVHPGVGADAARHPRQRRRAPGWSGHR